MWEYKDLVISLEDNLEHILNDFGKDNWQLAYLNVYNYNQ